MDFMARQHKIDISCRGEMEKAGELLLLNACPFILRRHIFKIQSTLVISKSKGPAETLRDIRTSTYQMCRIEENTKGTTKIHK